jgi:hypothetical protein
MKLRKTKEQDPLYIVGVFVELLLAIIGFVINLIKVLTIPIDQTYGFTLPLTIVLFGCILSFIYVFGRSTVMGFNSYERLLNSGIALIATLFTSAFSVCVVLFFLDQTIGIPNSENGFQIIWIIINIGSTLFADYYVLNSYVDYLNNRNTPNEDL